MSLRAFLYATEVLRLQHEDSFHVETQPENVPARNAESMNTLMGVMAQVQGAPKIS